MLTTHTVFIFPQVALPAWLRDMAGRLANRLALEQRHRASLGDLAVLNERDLTDIGLERSYSPTGSGKALRTPHPVW